MLQKLPQSSLQQTSFLGLSKLNQLRLKGGFITGALFNLRHLAPQVNLLTAEPRNYAYIGPVSVRIAWAPI